MDIFSGNYSHLNCIWVEASASLYFYQFLCALPVHCVSIWLSICLLPALICEFLLSVCEFPILHFLHNDSDVRPCSLGYTSLCLMLFLHSSILLCIGYSFLSCFRYFTSCPCVFPTCAIAYPTLISLFFSLSPVQSTTSA